MKSIVFCVILINTVFFAQTPAWTWVKTAGSVAKYDFAGGYGDDCTSSIATDATGNSYVTGHFTGTAVFGTITVSSPLYPAVFTAKYDALGNCLWVKYFGAKVPPPPAPLQVANQGRAIDIDSLGNCYVTGSFHGAPNDTIYFGTSKLVGFDDSRSEIFLVKYDSNGNEIWARQCKYISGALGLESSTSISVDKTGNSFVSFYLNYNNLGSFGNLPPVSGHGGYVVKFDAGGTPLWTRQLGISSSGAPNGVFPYAIENDGAGNCYVTGVLSGTAVAGTSPPTTLTAIGTLNQQWNTFIAKLNANGSIAWIKQFSGPQSLSFGKGIGVDASGNIIVGGNYNGTITVGTNTFTGYDPVNTTNKYNIFFCKLDPSGNVIWANKLALDQNELGALKVTPPGHFYFAASNFTTGSVCGNNIPGNGQIIVGKMNTAGSCQWLQYAASSPGGVQGVSGLGIDALEDVYIAGGVMETATFGAYTVTSAGGSDVMVSKLSGTLTGTSVADLLAKNVINAYPNPFETEFYLDIKETNATNPSRVLLTDILGQVVGNFEVGVRKNILINRNGLPNGVYFYHLYADDKKIFTGKVIAN